MVAIGVREYVQPICKTCGWVGGRYYCDEEGCESNAELSAVIETRLGHLKDTAQRVGGKLVSYNFV